MGFSFTSVHLGYRADPVDTRPAQAHNRGGGYETVTILEDLLGDLRERQARNLLDKGTQRAVEFLRREKLDALCFLLFGRLEIDVETGFRLDDDITLEPWDTINPPIPNLGFGEGAIKNLGQLQFDRGEWIVVGWLDISELAGSDDEVARRAVNRVEEVVSFLGYWMFTQLRWAPVMPSDYTRGLGRVQLAYLPTTISIGHDEVAPSEVMKYWREFQQLPEERRVEVKRAMEWFRLGFTSDSVFNSFLMYWLSVESLSNTWAALSGYSGNPDNIQAKTALAFRACFGDDAGKHLTWLFQGNPSPKEIRNQVAHGIISESDTDVRAHVARTSVRLRELSYDFIGESIREMAPSEPKI